MLFFEVFVVAIFKSRDKSPEIFQYSIHRHQITCLHISYSLKSYIYKVCLTNEILKS